MRITGTQTQVKEVDVDISERTLLEFASAIVGKRHDIDVEEYFLSHDETEIRANDEYRHGSVTDHLVRKATAKEKEAFKVIEYLQNLAKTSPEKET